MNQKPIYISRYIHVPLRILAMKSLEFSMGPVKLSQANATTAAWFLREEVADPPGFATFRQKILTLGFCSTAFHIFMYSSAQYRFKMIILHIRVL